METLIGAIVGAVVGGAFAIAGSVSVGRYELTRRHRVKIHLTLLPRLLDSLDVENLDGAEEQALGIEREATVASRADRRRAQAILARTGEA